MNRRQILPRTGALVASLALAAGGAWISRDARASVSIAVGWTELLHDSTAAAVVTAQDARAVWEGGRIFTYTHVRVERAIAGELATGAFAWVRTRGGVVGHVGQLVEGEAVLASKPSLVFLNPGAGAGTYDVTARAQGQFPLLVDDPVSPAHVIASRALGMILPRALPAPALPPRLASEVLDGQSVDDAARTITAAWGAAHAR
jgi:hypothetical protein